MWSGRWNSQAGYRLSETRSQELGRKEQYLHGCGWSQRAWHAHFSGSMCTVGQVSSKYRTYHSGGRLYGSRIPSSTSNGPPLSVAPAQQKDNGHKMHATRRSSPHQLAVLTLDSSSPKRGPSSQSAPHYTLSAKYSPAHNTHMYSNRRLIPLDVLLKQVKTFHCNATVI